MRVRVHKWCAKMYMYKKNSYKHIIYKLFSYNNQYYFPKERKKMKECIDFFPAEILYPIVYSCKSFSSLINERCNPYIYLSYLFVPAYYDPRLSLYLLPFSVDYSFRSYHCIHDVFLYILNRGKYQYHENPIQPSFLLKNVIISLVP